MWKTIAKIVGGVLLALVLLVSAVKFWADRTYFNDYHADAPYNVQVREVTQVNPGDPVREYQLVNFTFDGKPGEAVPTFLALPKKATGKVPVVIFLHGIGQKKDFLKEICQPFLQTGFAIASFDQYMRGERRLPGNTGKIAEALAFRQRPAKTINEARRLVGYLANHPQIDPQRIYLAGASYGAITGSTVLAFEKRIRAGVLIYGGANIPLMLDAPMIREGAQKEGYGWLLPPARVLAGWFLGVSDPKRYAAKVLPTPVYVQAGSHDSLVWPEASKALIHAIGNPTKVQWYDSDHIGMDKDSGFSNTKAVLKDALTWLLEQDDTFRTEDQKIKVFPDFEIENP